MTDDLSQWAPRPRPERKTWHGQYVTIEPLTQVKHARGLFEASNVADKDIKFAWLYENPPTDFETFSNWVATAAVKTDQLFFAILDAQSGQVTGRQTLMRIDAANGVAEIGAIYWGPKMAGTRLATEALYLFTTYIFDTLGYRRFEWKCNDNNAPSKVAAQRFGFQFEGVFRQHMVVKGQNRDTAWFAMTDQDWITLKPAYQAWLSPDNFDSQGQQIHRLAEFQSKFGAS